MAQSKEEVILSRLTEMRIRLALFRTPFSKLSEDQRQMIQDLMPEQILARLVVLEMNFQMVTVLPFDF